MLLKWNDFQGIPPSNVPIAAASMTRLNISIEEMRTDSLLVEVKAIFDPSKSWVREKRPALLAHEQGHFDITELFARQLCKEIVKTTLLKSNGEMQLVNLLEKYSLKIQKYQALYDRETDFSRHE